MIQSKSRTETSQESVARLKTDAGSDELEKLQSWKGLA